MSCNRRYTEANTSPASENRSCNCNQNEVASASDSLRDRCYLVVWRDDCGKRRCKECYQNR